MKNLRNILLFSLFVFLCTPAEAQVVNRINRAAQNAAQRAAEKAATKKAEEEATKAAEKGVQAAEKGIQAAAEANKNASTTTVSESVPYDGPVIAAPKDDTKFPFEHGSYVMISEALGIEAQQTVYFTRSGEWKAFEDKSEVKVFGITVKSDKMHIIKGNQHWNLDLAEKTGTYYESDVAQEDPNALLSAALGGDPEEGMEVIDLGQEVYLGYTCKKTQVKYPVLAMDMICLSYGTLPMKCDGMVGPIKTSTRIISIDLNNPPASKFEVPAGITID